MNVNEMLRMVVDTLMQHIPQSANWIPLAGLVGVTLFGLVLMLRGAKLAPLLAAVTLLGVGAIGGSFASKWLGTPVWPTIAGAGVVGFVAGLLLFRFWQAILLAACFALVSLGVYHVRVLTPYVANYTSVNFDAERQLVSLPEPGAALTERVSAGAELSQFWSYLAQNVPSFQTSFLALVISTGLAGLVIGLLLPKLTRALWAATVGTIFFAAGATALLEMAAPTALNWLISLGSWGWGVMGVVWALSLFYNLIACREKRPKKSPGDDASGAAPAVA